MTNIRKLIFSRTNESYIAFQFMSKSFLKKFEKVLKKKI